MAAVLALAVFAVALATALVHGAVQAEGLLAVRCERWRTLAAACAADPHQAVPQPHDDARWRGGGRVA